MWEFLGGLVLPLLGAGFALLAQHLLARYYGERTLTRSQLHEMEGSLAIANDQRAFINETGQALQFGVWQLARRHTEVVPASEHDPMWPATSEDDASQDESAEKKHDLF